MVVVRFASYSAYAVQKRGERALSGTEDEDDEVDTMLL
jgi:hypothetical protein